MLPSFARCLREKKLVLIAPLLPMIIVSFSAQLNHFFRGLLVLKSVKNTRKRAYQHTGLIASLLNLSDDRYSAIFRCSQIGFLSIASFPCAEVIDLECKQAMDRSSL
ncbi:hypothetical protein L596_028784 [Steinernema carpocapsae]|uniref:Uncharacterized protein n=1 Tax=Steinernema carpocapsae TaxID=34508 RepID=A0A4U5LZC8_STECR|nr:hypothetical protein L596_028784 [Steinernema carpocapsae]